MQDFHLARHRYMIYINTCFSRFESKSLLIQVFQEVAREFSHIISLEHLLVRKEVRVRVFVHGTRFPTVSSWIRVQVSQILCSVFSVSQIPKHGSLSWVIIHITWPCSPTFNVRITIVRAVTFIERVCILASILFCGFIYKLLLKFLSLSFLLSFV